MRGPAVTPGPLSPRGVPSRTPGELFDAIVLGAVARLEERCHDRLGAVEFAVEEAPVVTHHDGDDPVPLASLVPGTSTTPARLVLFRRPIELRCETRADVDALVHTVLVEQVSELLGVSPEEIDPGYDAG